MLTATLPCVPLSLQAQAPAASSANSFEVASVRAASKGAHETFPQYPSPQFVAENLPLTLLIAIAYDTADNRIVNKPEWLDDTSYTVRAKPDGEAALTEKQYRPLLQDLLRERFKLVVHLETRYVSGYELVLAKGGPKLEPSQPADAMAYILENGLQSASTNTGELASLLSRPLGKPVVDRTGLAGSYKLKLRFAPTGGTA